jgi:hypothetical protein
MKKPRFTVVVEESKTGMNQKLRDNETGVELNRTKLARAVYENHYLAHYHYSNGDK